MSSAIRVVRASAQRDIQRAFAIRMRVFVKEQKVPPDIELDEDDSQAIHLLALIGEKAVGTARIVFHGGRA